MKILFCFLSMFTAFSSVASAPDFKISNNMHLSDLKGQVVYVDFWASWCKPCRASFPWMNQMHKQYKDKGLKVIAINLDEDSAAAKTFLSKVPALFSIVYDPQGNIAERYKLIGMPTSYLIDKNGELRVTHTGFFTKKASGYEREIQQLLSE
ncbi:TlpA disulfide reductase family protein [uncultured Paraglaciecola sp.]|uniref:TlpA disulfide reductase family protein n=1 Tax=uncultured Paraglaciecola sp. TaxID=1765024 RepID=UPI0025997E49|nr:TlpA disulfide reductase family protein [uncultured Paraglaciecola sp.]